jgi:hypothetical protein
MSRPRTMIAAFNRFLEMADVDPRGMEVIELKRFKAAFIAGLQLGASVVQFASEGEDPGAVVDGWASEIDQFWKEHRNGNH